MLLRLAKHTTRSVAAVVQRAQRGAQRQILRYEFVVDLLQDMPDSMSTTSLRESIRILLC